MTCAHPSFRADVRVHRCVSGQQNEVVDFSADVEIRCIACEMPFRFKGLPVGMSFERPMCGVDRLEARLPIEPADEGMH